MKFRGRASGKNKKQIFIVDFIKSINKFDYYKQIANKKMSENIKYFFKLVAFYSIILTVCTIININNGIKELKNLINEEITSLNYSSGILSINNDENKTLFNKYVIIDTSKENLEELENKAQIVIGKEYCTVKLDNNILKIKYNDYFYADINKEDIINILSNLSIKFYIIMSVIVLIWIFILMTISTITDVLVIATMGYIISKIINKQFTFTNIFNIAIHAITLSVLLGGIYYIINSLTGFYMKYFSIMYTSIAIIYIMTSILLITSDNNENNNIQDD